MDVKRHRRRALHGLLVGAWLVVDCGTPSPASLVPSDYRTRLTEVRNCRETIDHRSPTGRASNPDIVYIRVLVNPESADAYRMNQNPLPPNTLVIKEEAHDSLCNEVVAWSVMHKEAGFDPAHHDWHYQRVLHDGTIEVDGRVAGCIGVSSCHSNPDPIDQLGCVPRDYMCTAP